MITDGKFVHLVHECVPWDDGLGLSEEGVWGERILGGGAVGEEEANGDLVVAWVRGRCDCRIGHQLKGHRRSVVDDAGEVFGGGGELGKAEEGEEGSIGTELDADLGLGLSSDGRVELLDDLGGENASRNGSDRFT